MNRVVSTTEARKNIFSLTRKVQVPGVHYVLTEKGSAKAVVMSASEFESWQETLEVVSDVPDIGKRLSRAVRDIKAGKVIDLDTAKERYGVSRTPRARGRKGSR